MQGGFRGPPYPAQGGARSGRQGFGRPVRDPGRGLGLRGSGAPGSAVPGQRSARAGAAGAASKGRSSSWGSTRSGLRPKGPLTGGTWVLRVFSSIRHSTFLGLGAQGGVAWAGSISTRPHDFFSAPDSCVGTQDSTAMDLQLHHREHRVRLATRPDACCTTARLAPSPYVFARCPRPAGSREPAPPCRPSGRNGPTRRRTVEPSRTETFGHRTQRDRRFHRGQA